MNNIFVYCEIEDGVVSEVSLELLTKGRTLANKLGCKLEAVVAGSKLDGIEKQVMPFGGRTARIRRSWPLPIHFPAAHFGNGQPVQGGKTSDMPYGRHRDRP